MSEVDLTVVVITWNAVRDIKTCLTALSLQQMVRFETLVVDNASQDGTLDVVRSAFPEVRVLANERNLGFSRAFNQAVRASSSPWILSLNADVTVQEHFLTELLAAAQLDAQIGMAAPKLLQASNPDRLDSSGLFLDRRRRPFDRGQGKPDDGRYDARREVFGACGGAALYRRAMLTDVSVCDEVMDEDFFAYYEDADLAWRAQMRGWQARFAPRAVATHVRGSGDTLRRGAQGLGPRLALRNRYLMTVKNDCASAFLADLPRIAAAEIPRLVYAGFTQPKTLGGLVDFLRLFPSAWRKRQQIRARRKITDRDLRLRWFLSEDVR